MTRRVVVLQELLTHYRVEFFEQLHERLAADGVELVVAHGHPDALRADRDDSGTLAWAVEVPTRHLDVRVGTLVWQSAWRLTTGADLVVVEQGNRHLLNYLLVVRRRFSGPRIAWWGHGRNRQSRRPDAWREKWKRAWLSAADWWFAYTQSVADDVVARGFPADHVTVVQNSVRPACTNGPLALERIRARCVFLGSLYADKRLDVLVDACDVIAGQVPGFSVEVIGAGPARAGLDAAAATRPWLHLSGPRRGDDLATRLSQAQLMLMPGLVGLGVIEAFAAETPVVTMQWAHHSPEIDYLRDGENAVVLPDGAEAKDFASEVVELLASPQSMQRLREGCRAARMRYTLEAMVDNFATGIVRALDA